MIFNSRKSSMTHEEKDAMYARQNEILEAAQTMREYGYEYGPDAMQEIFEANGHDLIRTAQAIFAVQDDYAEHMQFTQDLRNGG